MRALVAYAVAVSIVVVALAFNLNAAHHRIAALEQQLAPAPSSAAGVKVGPAGRTFTARDGTVLNEQELARADERDLRASKAAAEWEYFMSKQQLPNARARKVNRP